jgi:hypothetical protein
MEILATRGIRGRRMPRVAKISDRAPVAPRRSAQRRDRRAAAAAAAALPRSWRRFGLVAEAPPCARFPNLRREAGCSAAAAAR